MKKSILLMLPVLLIGLASCSENEDLQKLSNDNPEATTKSIFSNEIEVCWNEEKQVIDGFGVAEADWASSVFTHPKRDEVTALLFGPNGLDLSLLRGEIFPHYWENENDSTFNTDEDVDMPLNDPYFTTATANDILRRGQLWVTKVAKQTYNVDKLLFSTWSPPAFMKTNGLVSKGSLKPEYYQRFAEYLAGFCKAYQEAGIDIYAISPVNEPNYGAEWNSCLWTEQELADFIVNNMGPTFQREGVPANIVFGELAQWCAPILGAMNLVSAKKYVENVINANPRLVEYADIAAGHGYNLPNIAFEFPIVPYDVAASKGLKVWLTEISTTLDTFDPSINNGLHWAEVFYKYLVNADVNAICWWAGARPTGNNESLIKLETDSYVLTKRFDTYGNYTRYIKPGSTRINAKKGLSVAGLLVSSFKKDNQYVVVVINKSGDQITTNLALNGATTTGNLRQYLTDANNQWTETEIQSASSGTYPITLPPSSVVTFVGSAN